MRLVMHRVPRSPALDSTLTLAFRLQMAVWHRLSKSEGHVVPRVRGGRKAVSRTPHGYKQGAYRQNTKAACAAEMGSNESRDTSSRRRAPFVQVVDNRRLGLPSHLISNVCVVLSREEEGPPSHPSRPRDASGEMMTLRKHFLLPRRDVLQWYAGLPPALAPAFFFILGSTGGPWCPIWSRLRWNFVALQTRLVCNGHAFPSSPSRRSCSAARHGVM